MSDLAELQRQFAAALRGDDAAPLAARVRSAGVDPARRIALYRANGEAARHDALGATYPVVRRLVGDAFFRELARCYGLAHPSRSGDLHLHGGALAEFIAAYPHARALPYLADVARLEWACHESLHAADAPPLDPHALAGVAPERQGAVRLALHPAVRLVESPHPAIALWEANQPGRDGTPDRSAGFDRAFVWRDAVAVRLRRMDAAEWRFVRALMHGATLEDAVEAMGEGDAEGLLAPLLARLAADGALAGFTLGEGDA